MVAPEALPAVTPAPGGAVDVPGAEPASAGGLRDVERQHIVAVLKQTGWRIDGPNGAARVLNLHPSTLRSRIQKLGIRRSAELS
jgi:transcriptional regulator with GAF, ATPase, and Fis domain